MKLKTQEDIRRIEIICLMILSILKDKNIPVGNGIFNIDKSIEDIKWIIENEIKKEEQNLLCEIL